MKWLSIEIVAIWKEIYKMIEKILLVFSPMEIIEGF